MAKNLIPGIVGQKFAPLLRYLENGALQVLTVGFTSLTSYYYTSGLATWLDIDGVNPPTVPALRIIDQNTGTAYRFTVQSGSLYISSQDGAAVKIGP